MSEEGYFTHKGQNIMNSTTIILNREKLDNAEEVRYDVNWSFVQPDYPKRRKEVKGYQ